jgi:hypothetical protein
VTFNPKDYPAPQDLVDAMSTEGSSDDREVGEKRTGEVLRAVHHERRRQDTLVAQGKFLWNCGDPRVPWSEKLAVLVEEVGEAGREVVEWMISRDKYAADPQLLKMPPHREKYFRDRLRTELIQAAAVCVAFAESLTDEPWRSTDPLSPEAKKLMQEQLTKGSLYVDTDSNRGQPRTRSHCGRDPSVIGACGGTDETCSCECSACQDPR